MCRASIYDARNKPVAVIISYEEYEKESSKNKTSWLSEWREEYKDVLSDEGIPLGPKVYADPNRVIFEE